MDTWTLMSGNTDRLFHLVFCWVHSLNKYVLSAFCMSLTYCCFSFEDDKSQDPENGSELTLGFTISNWQHQDQNENCLTPGSKAITSYLWSISIWLKPLDLLLDVFLPFFLSFLFSFISLFMAVLDFHCCTRAFSSCGEGGYSSLRCAGFSLQWLLLLRSTGSRAHGLQ